MLSDLLVNSCLRQTIMLHRQLSSSAVFSYIFSHSGSEVNKQWSMDNFHIYSIIWLWFPGSVLHCEEYGPGARTAVKKQWSQTRPVWRQVSLAKMITMMVMVLIPAAASVASVGMMSPSPGIVWRGDDLLYLWQLSSAQVWLQYVAKTKQIKNY